MKKQGLVLETKVHNNSCRQKVIVTGAGGFIGRHFVASEGKNFEIILPQRGFDVGNWENVKKLPKADVVLNLAAVSSIPACKQNPGACFSTNSIGVFNLLEYCRLHKARLVQASSVSVYGTPEKLPVLESHSRKPVTTLGHTKLFAELACEAYAADYGIPSIALRMFSVYGPGQSEEFMIASFIRQAKEKHEIAFENGNRKRDLLYIDDAIPAMASAVKLEHKGFSAINIGCGKCYSIKQVAEEIGGICGAKKVFETGEGERKGEVNEIYADNSKARRLLGLKVKTRLAEGLRKTASAAAG